MKRIALKVTLATLLLAGCDDSKPAPSTSAAASGAGAAPRRTVGRAEARQGDKR